MTDRDFLVAILAIAFFVVLQAIAAFLIRMLETYRDQDPDDDAPAITGTVTVDLTIDTSAYGTALHEAALSMTRLQKRLDRAEDEPLAHAATWSPPEVFDSPVVDTDRDGDVVEVEQVHNTFDGRPIVGFERYGDVVMLTLGDNEIPRQRLDGGLDPDDAVPSTGPHIDDGRYVDTDSEPVDEEPKR